MIAAIGSSALWLAAVLGALQGLAISLRAKNRDCRALAAGQWPLLAVATIASAICLAQGRPLPSLDRLQHWLLAASLILPAMLVAIRRRGKGPATRRWLTGQWVVLSLLLATPPTSAEPSHLAIAALWLGAFVWLQVLGGGWRPARWLARGGVAVALVGAAVAWGGATTREARLSPGGAVTVGGWRVELVTVAPAVGPDWTALEAFLTAGNGRQRIALRPQLRTMISGGSERGEPASVALPGGTFTAELLPGTADSYEFRLTWNPLIALISLGAILMALAALLDLARLRLRKRGRQERYW